MGEYRHHSMSVPLPSPERWRGGGGVSLLIALLLLALLMVGMYAFEERSMRIYNEKEMLRYRDMWDNATWKRPDRKDDRP
jgi:hypothetical protein